MTEIIWALKRECWRVFLSFPVVKIGIHDRAGGIVVQSANGKIRMRSTLETRLENVAREVRQHWLFLIVGQVSNCFYLSESSANPKRVVWCKPEPQVHGLGLPRPKRSPIATCASIVVCKVIVVEYLLLWMSVCEVSEHSIYPVMWHWILWCMCGICTHWTLNQTK